MAMVDDAKRPQFLFLPNTTKLSIKPDENLRRVINRHVQRHAARKHKPTTIIPATIRPLKRQTNAAKNTDSSDRDDRSEIIDEVVPRTPENAPSSELMAVTASMGPQTYLDSSRMDPFSTSSISLNQQTAPIYNYYFSIIMPTVEPVHQEREEYNSWLVPLTLKEPALLYALLACMAYDLEEISSSGFGPNRKRDMLDQRVQYKVWSIQALNRCLSDPTIALKPSTLIAVHFLLWQEMFTDDDCVHIDGVKRLLELRGGFKGIQRKAIEAIMIGNTWRAIRTRSRPILSQVTDDLPMTDCRYDEILSGSDICVAKTSSAILRPSMRSNFGPSFWKLLQDAQRVWICFEQIGTFPFEPLEKRHVSIKRVNIDHRLLSYVFDHPDDEDHSPIQEPIRLAIILYSSAHYNVVQPSSKVARALITDLKEALEHSDHMRNLWDDASGVLLWVLFLGAHMSLGQVERSWFVAAMCKIRASKMKEKNVHAARRALMACYWSDRVFMDSLKKVWSEVETLSGLLSMY